MEAVRRVQIIATSAAGTRSALAAAKRLVATDAQPIVLLVPHLMSVVNPAQDPRGSTRLADQYRALARGAGVEIAIRLCICRHYRDMFAWMLARPSLVVIGGRRRWWWPTRAERMARDLQRAGHAVVFADVG